ncbi:MAG: MFS transporter [Alphaproteobacteria bacterium]|jgi:MFS family permease|nr:MFS transporter [Alphaproteobacteria bacterium]
MLRSATAEPRLAYRHVMLAASVLLFLVGMGGMFLLVVALKPMALDFGWPRTVPSLAFSLQFIGGGTGGILMGYWMDRAGAGRPAILGAIMLGTGTMLASRVDNMWELYLIYGVMLGFLGQSTLFTPLMTNVTLWFRENRGMALGIVASGQSIAGVVWPPVFRYFNDAIGWRETFFWYGALVLATMLPLSLLLQRRPPLPELMRPAGEVPAKTARGRRRPGLAALGGISPNRLQLALCTAIVGCCVAMSLPLGHIVAHTSDLGFPLARGAEMLSLILGGSFLSRAFGGFMIIDRFGGLRSLFVFSGLQAAGMGLYAVVGDLVGLYLVSFLFGLGYGGINMCYPSIIRDFLPAGEAGRRMGLVTLFGAFGMAIGGWLGGFVFDLWGTYTPAFLIGMTFNVANLAIVLTLVRLYRNSPRPAPAVA